MDANSSTNQYESYAAGQTIFVQGQPGDKMYVVKEGDVDLTINGKPIMTVTKGGLFGEMALIDPNTRSATATAQTDCVLIAIDEHQFKKLIQTTPKFALEVMKVMAQRLRHMDTEV